MAFDHRRELLLHAAGRPAAPLVPARKGLVRLEGRATADDGGAFLAIGTSLFWAISGERQEPDRLDRNLATIAGRLGFVRIFGDVGGPGYWQDRDTHADWGDYWSVVLRLFARLKRHGLRAEVTVFAGSPAWPLRAQREAFVHQWIEFIHDHGEQVILSEAANENIGTASLEETLAHASALRNALPNLSGTTAAPGIPNGFCLTNTRDDAAPVHYERAFLADGSYRPIRQPWGWPAEYGDCPLPTAWNNEPIGISSSINEENDPRRLVTAAVVSFIAGNSGHVLHTGAGVRGQEDGVRRANLWEQPTFGAAVNGLAALAAYLPAALPSWQRANHHWFQHPFNGFTEAINAGACIRAYAAYQGPAFVVAPIGCKWAFSVSPKQASEVEVRDPLDGRVLARYGPGQEVPLSHGLDCYVLTGRAV